MVVFHEENELMHYGILRKSGRYPWGSGGDTATRSRDFLQIIEDLIRQGLSLGAIAKGFDMRSEGGLEMKTIDLIALKSIATNEVKAANIAQAQAMKMRGVSNVEIGKALGIPESTVRAYLKPGAEVRRLAIHNTADMMREEVDSKGFVDIGRGVENYLGVSKERKDAATTLLKDEGYKVWYIKNPQIGTGENTNYKILGPPGSTWKEAKAAFDAGLVSGPVQASDDYGETWFGIKTPLSINPKRVEIIYGEDGGAQHDGVVYVRPGLKDLDMGGKQYGQVRIQVGKEHFIKGMAIYKDDLPDGVDLAFNTNKSRAEAPTKEAALKALKDDDDNPFGAMVRQITDENGNVTSALNLVNEQGKWSTWSNTISTQVLSKQSPSIAKSQLNMTMERRINEFEEISQLTNPTVKKRLLQDFADGTDAAAVHLRAAALPGQRWHVILPIDSLKDNEIYAPNYNNGDRVALIRYPHGGTFEIPELTVNNKHRDARKTIGPQAEDAVGINARVAERLSGADFDGDTVLVIPNRKGTIKSTPALKELDGFAPREQYKKYEGMKVISQARMQREMGDVSNLITDMTIRNAPDSEIARAVRHSMVVIDSYKHELNYKQSAKDNGIAALKKKYQVPYGSSGASTLISRAEADLRINARRPSRAGEGGPIDKETGRLNFTETGETYVDKRTGKTVVRQQKIKKLEGTDDAHTLSSNTPIERIYADHSNRLKALANTARREMVNTPRGETSPSAKATYSKEVATLNAKLDLALKAAPLERQAQALAQATMREKKREKPDMTKEEEKKLKYRALEVSRARMGVKEKNIVFTPQEWEAIQAGAISDSKLSQILNYADMERVRELATPRTRLTMTPARTSRALAMLNSGFTRKEVSDALGVSLSTLDESLSDS